MSQVDFQTIGNIIHITNLFIINFHQFLQYESSSESFYIFRRLYQIEDEVVCLGTYLVGDKPMAKMPCSKITFLGALGEIAVDFDFGHPEINEQASLEKLVKKEKGTVF